MKSIYLFLLLWPVVALPQTTPYQWHLQTGLSPVPPPGDAPSMSYDTARKLTFCLPSSPVNTNLTRPFPGIWRWGGIGWTPPSDASSTERQWPVAIAFDTARGVLVLYCLNTHDPDTDPFASGITWEWSGSIWRLASTNGPPNRDDMGIAFDSHRGRTVVFGGALGLAGVLVPWTWEWDGIQWRVIATNWPSPRQYTAMAYDAKRRVTVLFGGVDGPRSSDPPRRDTWTWNGTNWTPVSVAGPTARYKHAMAYDSVRERVLLYGGTDRTEPSNEEGLGDLWEWDGSQWILSSTDGPRHYWHGMAFDSSRGEAIVFGGSRNRISLQETWLLKLRETWVDFSYAGIETGAFDSPFNTAGEGVSAAPDGSILKIKTGSSPENLTISKRLSVQAFNGPVTIGQ
jgi:hypothetical protein